MRYFVAVLLSLFAFPAFAQCPDPLPENTVCVQWQAPTENTDGTPLTDLAGFELFWGFFSGDFDQSRKIDIPDASETEFTTPATSINIQSPGPEGGEVDVFFVMTAYDDDGNTSGFSNEISRAVTFPDTQAPGEPTILDVIINVVITPVSS